MTEILAPCGSPEALTAALRAGCTAVYLGGESFSARQNAVNFTDGEIEKAVAECHRRGVKVYRTINTVLFDSQLEQCKAAVRHCAETGVDGIITQDLALTEIVKKCCPDLTIHASTQMTVHTADGMEMTERLGFSRTVLSRELPLDIIRELSSLCIETEVFVHGALCMSVSGQCYMSAVIGSRSANRGLCAQACRLPCKAVKDAGERFDLSLKDMSYLDSIKSLADAGVSSFKIEGRMKRPEYVASAVRSLSLALEGRPYDRQTLADVFSRSGFTDGYLRGKTGREMFGIRQKEDVKAAAKVFPAIHDIYRREEKRSGISFRFCLQSGKPVRLYAEDDQGNRAEVSGSIPETAQNKACCAETAEKQLSKLGDTIYSFNTAEYDIEDGLFISPSEINDLRRQVCRKLDGIRTESYTRRVKFTDCGLLDFPKIKTAGAVKLRIAVSRLEQLDGIDFSLVELCAVPLDIAVKAAESFPADKLAVSMPRFTFDEKLQKERLKAVKKAGISAMLATNLAHVRAAEELGFELHTDFGFNLTNSCALNAVKKLGAVDSVVSFELKAQQIAALKKPLPIGIFAYGRLPLMLTVNCPIAQAAGCRKCTGCVTDRTGRKFPVKCSRKEGYVEIMNSEKLYLADKTDRFRGIDFYMLYFSDESCGEVKRIISAYAGQYNKDKPDRSARDGNITAGLYFRGVM